MFAASQAGNGALLTLRLLLKAGADPSLVNEDGQTARDVAARLADSLAAAAARKADGEAREDAIRQLTVSNPHSWRRFRVDGIVRNIDAWYAAFDVQPTDRLYLEPARRARPAAVDSDGLGRDRPLNRRGVGPARVSATNDSDVAFRGPDGGMAAGRRPGMFGAGGGEPSVVGGDGEGGGDVGDLEVREA